jgi:tetratricopeptide (TPR) repeat protein
MRAKQVRWPGVVALVVGLAALVGGTASAQDDKKEEKNPQREELLKLNGATTKDSQDAKFRALIKDRAKAKKLVAEAAKMMKEARDKDEKPFNYNGTLILARAAHVVKEYDTAEKLYDHQVKLATKLKSGEKMLNAYDGLLDLYFDTKRYADAVDLCETIVDLKGPVELENAKPFVLERLIQAKAKQGKIDEATNMAKGLLELTDNSWYFLKLKGWVQREAGKIDDAITTYTDVLDKLDAEKGLKADVKDRQKDAVRYTLSGLYVENKEIDKAAKQLQTLITRRQTSLKKTDNERELEDRRELAGYKNDLGFIWCDHDMNLEESEKLIREALELDKQVKEKLKEQGKLDEVTPNAAYLDSMGWVLYKQKKYKEALDYLKKAAADEDDGNHLEIWDHLADAHVALGEKKEAIAAWEKALKMEDISKRDGERRRKVSEKLKKARDAVSKD